MRREEMADLTTSVVVAEERTFTRAAGKLGLSQSALKQTVRQLEARLGVHLRARTTTRSVAPTQAGERLVKTLTPMLHADALRHRSPEPKPRSKDRRRSA